MADDGFSPTQLQQMRQIVRDEVRSEVTTQLKPVHEKLDTLATKDQDDSDALNSVVVDLGERVQTLEGFHEITHKTAEA